MAKRTLQANYFADDKDVYDLLSAARQKLTPQKLAEFARRRGLVLSSEDDRGALIDQISRLPLGWKDLNALIEATDTAERAERTTSRSLSGSFSLDEVQEAIEALRDSRAEARGEVFKVEKLTNTLRVSVRYSELDPSRTRLVQRTQRDFSLEFELRSGGVFVRHQDQARAHEILGELVDSLKSKPEQTVEETRIELGGIREPLGRTGFFLQLIKGVKGFKFEDVKAVKASPFTKVVTDSLPPPDSDDASSDDLDPPGETAAGGITPDEAEFIAHVKEIALKGEGILKTPQYEHLTSHDFFVRSIVWTAVEDSSSGARVEFESGFDNPEEGTGFTYAIRGLYPRRADGEHKKGKIAPDSAERTRLLRLLEEAAREAVTGATEAAAGPHAPKNVGVE